MQSNSFTEMLYLDFVDFQKLLTNHENDEVIYNLIREKIEKEQDYSDIAIKCFI